MWRQLTEKRREIKALALIFHIGLAQPICTSHSLLIRSYSHAYAVEHFGFPSHPSSTDMVWDMVYRVSEGRKDHDKIEGRSCHFKEFRMKYAFPLGHEHAYHGWACQSHISYVYEPCAWDEKLEVSRNTGSGRRRLTNTFCNFIQIIQPFELRFSGGLLASWGS